MDKATKSFQLYIFFIQTFQAFVVQGWTGLKWNKELEQGAGTRAKWNQDRGGGAPQVEREERKLEQLEQRLNAIGYHIDYGRGDFKKN